jgi:hypothetical protein
VLVSGIIRSCVRLFKNKFRKLGFIRHNGEIRVNNSLVRSWLYTSTSSFRTTEKANKTRMCINVDRYPYSSLLSLPTTEEVERVNSLPLTWEDPNGNYIDRSSRFVCARRWGLGIFPLARLTSASGASRSTDPITSERLLNLFAEREIFGARPLRCAVKPEGLGRAREFKSFERRQQNEAEY